MMERYLTVASAAVLGAGGGFFWTATLCFLELRSLVVSLEPRAFSSSRVTTSVWVVETAIGIFKASEWGGKGSAAVL